MVAAPGKQPWKSHKTFLMRWLSLATSLDICAPPRRFGILEVVLGRSRSRECSVPVPGAFERIPFLCLQVLPMVMEWLWGRTTAVRRPVLAGTSGSKGS